MANQQFESKYRKNITDTRLTRLWGRNAEQTAASFNLYISGNAVRLRVSTGLRDDKERYSPTFGFVFKDGQIASLLTILDMLVYIKENPELYPAGQAHSHNFPIFGFIKTKKMDKAERREIGVVKIGRSSKGVYWISAESGDYGVVKFPFTLDRDIKLYKAGTNEEADEGFISERVMLSWVENTKLIIANTLTQEYTEPEEKDNNRQGNRGGYNRNNRGNNQGYQNSRNNGDDDYEGGNNRSNNQSNASASADNWDDEFLP